MRTPRECPEATGEVRHLILVRLLLMAVLGLLAWTAQKAGALGISPSPFMALLAAVWGLTLLSWMGVRLRVPLPVLAAAQIVLDLVIETILVAGTGGVSSPFVMLYFLTILTAAMFFHRRGAVLTALGAVTSLGAGVFLADEGGDAPLASLGYSMALHAAALLLLALLAGALAERSRRNRERLESAEVELKRVVSSTEQIIENMPIGVITATRDGRIVRTNRAACEILAVDPDANLCGQDAADFLGSFAERLAEALKDVLSSSAWSVREEILVKKGRREHPIGVSITPIVQEDTCPEGVIVTFTDLRELRHMEEEMRRSEQMANLGELAAGVAHEIRNPLASISGAIQVLRSEVRAEGADAELMDLIIRESDRLNRTIAGILDYTRDHSASRDVHDLSVIVREVVRLMSHDKDLTMGKTVLVEFPEDGPLLAEVEEEGMKQVFFNLARNAMEAMGLGGILRISGQRCGEGRVQIVFRDTGVGIPAHELEHIFQPFHTSKPEGTGLGLSIASRIVEGNGGTIRARSTPGMGTAITVELPGTGARAPQGSSGALERPRRERAPMVQSAPAR